MLGREAGGENSKSRRAKCRLRPHSLRPTKTGWLEGRPPVTRSEERPSPPSGKGPRGRGGGKGSRHDDGPGSQGRTPLKQEGLSLTQTYLLLEDKLNTTKHVLQVEVVLIFHTSASVDFFNVSNVIIFQPERVFVELLIPLLIPK